MKINKSYPCRFGLVPRHIMLEQMEKEDNEFTLNYFVAQREILFNLTKEELFGLEKSCIIFEKHVVNFNELVTYYQVAFYLYLSLEDFKKANIYLRSFRTCIDLMKKQDINIESVKEYFQLLETNYNGLVIMLNTSDEYKIKGRKNKLLKYFLSNEHEMLEREIQIRVTMRAVGISRSTALQYIKSL